MVADANDKIDALFYAFSDATRRGMLLQLTKGPATVSELGRPYSISKQAVSKHLMVLEKAGLVSKDKEGRLQRCHLEAKAFDALRAEIAQFERFWEHQLDGLGTYIDKLQHKGKEE